MAGAKLAFRLRILVGLVHPLGNGRDELLELGIVAAARGYGVSMGDLLMVAEDVAQGRLSLPWPTAVPSGMDYYLVWPRTRRGGERLRRLSAFLEGEVAAMDLPDVEILPPL